MAYIEKPENATGNARVYGDARVSGNACVTGDARVTGDAYVTGDARISTPQGCMSAYFQARTGVYYLTLYRVEDGAVGFTWGCREGTNFRAYLDQPGYETLKAAPLAFLQAFELANPLTETTT